MATNIITKKEKKSAIKMQEAVNYYMSKYKRIFLHKYKVDGLDHQANNFLFSQLWEKGKFAMFPLLKDSEEVIITPFSENEWNIYNYPTKVNLINLRGANFIPATIQEVGKDVLVCYGLPDKRPIREAIAWNVEKIVSCETLINICVDTHKLPFILAVSPESKGSLKATIDAVLEGESVVYTSQVDANSIKTLINSAPFIIDKLMLYKNDRENEIKTILGIQNYNTQDKSQYMNVDTINANNDEIESSGCLVLDQLEEFFEEFEETFKISLFPRLRHEVETPIIKEEGETENV